MIPQSHINHEAFPLPSHGCEVVISYYPEQTKINSTCQRLPEKCMVLRGKVALTHKDSISYYEKGEWIEIEADQTLSLTFINATELAEFWINQ